MRHQDLPDREALEREEGSGTPEDMQLSESTPNVEMELFKDTDRRR